MRAYPLLALLTVSASAVPQDTKRALLEARLDLPADITDGLEIDPDIIGKTVFHISHAYKVTRDNRSARASKIRSKEYSLQSAGQCVLQRKRAGVCDPAGWSEEPKKTPPEQTGPGEDDGKGKGKGKGKGGITGQKITESKFLQFVAELDPELIRPLVEAVQSGEITVSDIQLAFKRALSETMEKRWVSFKSGNKAAETLKNIVINIFATARYATPPEFWQDVARNLPDIAREISKGKTPEEKLKIANKNVNEVVNVWSYTPVGVLNENIMKEAANNAPPVQAIAVSLNNLWSYTPFGWLVNQIAPVDSGLRRINVRDVMLTLGQ
ncbi:Transcription elongation factor A [Metarhizium guizhouense ARSEF 977]|uniref:Transcription elongation factor A n=1 Tax=Metarhizium guizhouense (strain ARSEF 977) TaxID=1276136 RepID=A0A0B4HB45_METGA|nr:Transcription elongation factor A [Metarhizium guizhouense ARSEF 977]